MKFGNILKTLRKEAKITQSELASELGLSPSAIGFYEQNRREPDFETLCKIAEFFNVDSDYLLCKSSYKRKENEEFRNEKDALRYILQTKQMQKFAKYKITDFEEEEIESFCKDIANFIKIAAYKYKK